MHLGLIGGIGPAATDLYYRGLIRAARQAERPLELTIVHADARELVRRQIAGEATAQAEVFARLIDRLATAGAEAAAVTSIAGHFCMETLRPLSPLPLIDLIDALDAHLTTLGDGPFGVIGTRAVMESQFYGRLASHRLVAPPEPMRSEVHDAYVAMATSGAASDTARGVFSEAGRRLVEAIGATGVMLGGTDLFLAVDAAASPFPVIDCAQIHIDRLAEVALPNASA